MAEYQNLFTQVRVEAPSYPGVPLDRERDTKERGRTEQGIKDQFYKQVKPMHDEWVDLFTAIKRGHLPCLKRIWIH